jgi:putative Holliday junction resolvase
MRILAVDPGEKRIGLALSDPTGTIANPLAVIVHVSRAIDAAQIATLAEENEARRILVGVTSDEDGELTPQGRNASRLAAAIRLQTHVPVELWDESGSTQAVRQASIAMGVSSHKRRRQGHSHLDDLAATYILQTYLDAHAVNPDP